MNKKDATELAKKLPKHTRLLENKTNTIAEVIKATVIENEKLPEGWDVKIELVEVSISIGKFLNSDHINSGLFDILPKSFERR